MSVTVTATRPSSLPLPKTLSYSDPAARFLQKRAGLTIGQVHPVNLLDRRLTERAKLHSTGSSSSGSPAGTPTERQAKSLTPERSLQAPVRKASSTRTLIVGRSESFRRRGGVSICGPVPRSESSGDEESDTKAKGKKRVE